MTTAVAKNEQCFACTSLSNIVAADRQAVEGGCGGALRSMEVYELHLRTKSGRNAAPAPAPVAVAESER